MASLLASLILSSVDFVTSKGGKQSWDLKDINRGHFESYYWLLVVPRSNAQGHLFDMVSLAF